MSNAKPKLIDFFPRDPKGVVLATSSGPVSVPRPTPHPPPAPALLTITEAAAQLGVGEVTVRRWVADGTIYALTLGTTGRVKRIPAGEIERIRNLGHRTAG